MYMDGMDHIQRRVECILSSLCLESPWRIGVFFIGQSPAFLLRNRGMLLSHDSNE